MCHQSYLAAISSSSVFQFQGTTRIKFTASVMINLVAKVLLKLTAMLYTTSTDELYKEKDLQLIFMVKSPTIFIMQRLAIVKWADLLRQWEQSYLAEESPSLGFNKVKNKGVLEEAMMFKMKKLQNRNFSSSCWSVTVDNWARFVSVLKGIFPFRIFHYEY